MQKRILAFIELLSATAFWGFGFIATVWALKFWSATEISVLRFFIAMIPSFFYFVFYKTSKEELKFEFQITLLPGFLLALTLALQTLGLKFTTPAKSAFITTTYVVIVPLISHFLKKRVSTLNWIWVAIALIGSFLVSGAFEDTQIRWGDLPTFLCAIGAAIHIYWLEQVANKSKSAIMFGIGQNFWALIFSLIFLGLEAQLDSQYQFKFFSRADFQAWLGILCLAFGSTVIGFTLQVKAQKEISASVASILFLLEAPMAFGFSYFLIGEVMSLFQFAGALLIVLSCLGSMFYLSKKPSP